ncbi:MULTISPECIES: iron-containing alcohol dehydrogenase [Vagococcus]|uniref:NADH-dependent butanol dehydrogenase A n=1 Tax=Vagococcus fluvialis bH819 TaxID=1255619 RepID=A0A1X6WPM6_9ENTE|nr:MULTISPECIES: iron-containing alcohol dehydrogenase [Vagococcus]SLM86281.1 NADH-dependent butanol dehydrogenase A [Vagococcus fluvialis bH819]HCM88892.1 NADH-dependent alcohol dehydrogenase [Vagococcus sp.]
MLNFNYHNPANIYFGQGEEKKVGKLINQYTVTKNVLVLYSGDYIFDLGIYQTIEEECQQYDINLFKNGDVVPNPELSLIQRLEKEVTDNNIDFILAVGGGSVIDTAKALSFGSLYEGDTWDFFLGKEEVSDALPIGVIATVASSGSEMSNATIVSKEKHKLGVETNLIIPKFSILNPEYTLKLPKYHTGVGVSDILTHLLERYFTNEKNVNLTDFLLEGAAKSLIINGNHLINDLENYELRAEIMWTASMAHNNSLELGREPDWASHRIEHEVSGQYGIVHGEGMAVIFPAWMTYVSKSHPDIFVQYGVRVFGIDPFAYTENEIITLGIEKTKEFFNKMGMRSTLAEFDIDNTHFEEMANRATKNDSQTVGHLKPLNSEDIINILKLAL